MKSVTAIAGAFIVNALIVSTGHSETFSALEYSSKDMNKAPSFVADCATKGQCEGLPVRSNYSFSIDRNIVQAGNTLTIAALLDNRAIGLERIQFGAVDAGANLPLFSGPAANILSGLSPEDRDRVIVKIELNGDLHGDYLLEDLLAKGSASQEQISSELLMVSPDHSTAKLIPIDCDGDICDCIGNTSPICGDSDNDGVANLNDNCRNTYNPNQANCDNDAYGDACDSDNSTTVLVNSYQTNSITNGSYTCGSSWVSSHSLHLQRYVTTREVRQYEKRYCNGNVTTYSTNSVVGSYICYQPTYAFCGYNGVPYQLSPVCF